MGHKELSMMTRMCSSYRFIDMTTESGIQVALRVQWRAVELAWVSESEYEHVTISLNEVLTVQKECEHSMANGWDG